MEENQLAEGLKAESGIPTSDADRLEVAAGEESESAHGDASQRAEEAWDSIPGDSEVEVDFKDVGIETDEPTLFPGFEMVSIPGTLETIQQRPPEFSVSIGIYHPDGRVWDFGAAVPVDDEEGLPDSEILQALRDQFDAAYEAIRTTLYGRRRPSARVALGLDQDVHS